MISKVSESKFIKQTFTLVRFNICIFLTLLGIVSRNAIFMHETNYFMSLGKKLKEARLAQKLTLRQVEDSTGISNPYLSQLENDKIKEPSSSILYKLASLYQIPFNALLKGAGLIDEQVAPENKVANEIAFYAHNLSNEDAQKILEYIKFIKFNKND